MTVWDNLDIDRANIFHAYLIVGGSASERLHCARKFAAEIFGIDDSEAASKIERETHEDLYYVTPEPGKREITVDKIRQLQTVFQSKPLASSRKIAIISEASAMNEASQNKLLKLLEEPTAGDIILLLAQNEEKLLPTVRSRCVSKRIKGGHRIEAEESHLSKVKDIVRILVYDRGVLAEAHAILDEYSETAEEAMSLLLSLEAFLRDMTVGTYNAGLLWDEGLTTNVEKMTPKMASRFMKCLKHAEVAKVDIDSGLKPKTTLRNMALQIKKDGIVIDA